MPFTDYENSQRLSNPIELYHFYDSSSNWYYCTGTESNFSFGGNTYVPAMLTRADINYTQNEFDEIIALEASNELPLLSDMVGRFQYEKVYLKIYRIQNADAGLYTTLWYGYIVNFTFDEPLSIIRVESIAGALNKKVIKQTATTPCRHILFGDQCGLAEASYKTNGTITAVSGTSISAAAFNTGTPDNFLGSMIVTADGEKRVVISDPGTGIVTILRPFSTATTGTTFYVTTKCNRLITGLCATASNTDNFGGFIFKGINPYKSLATSPEVILTNPVEENT